MGALCEHCLSSEDPDLKSDRLTSDEESTNKVSSRYDLTPA